MCETLGCRSESQVVEFVLIRGLFLNFIFALSRAAFCVRACVCEAKLRLSVIGGRRPGLSSPGWRLDSGGRHFYF